VDGKRHERCGEDRDDAFHARSSMSARGFRWQTGG
jgi:hypothetical protein